MKKILPFFKNCKKNNKVLFVFSLLLIINFNLFSQNFWANNHDLVGGNTYDNFRISSSGAIYVISQLRLVKRTVNEGNTWTAYDYYAYSSSSDQSYILAAVKGNILFVSSYRPLMPETGWGIKISTDNGTSWTKINNGLGADTNIAEVFVMPNGNLIAHYFSSTGVASKLYLSTNDGSSWTMVKDINMVNLNNMVVVANKIYLLGSESFSSTDNGQNWTALGPQWNYAIDLHVASNGDFYKTTNLSNDSLVYKSTDQGNSWIATPNTGLPPISGVIPVRLLGTPGDTLYFATYNSGIFYSPDLGQNWTTINSGLSSYGGVMDMALSKGGYLFLTRSAKGIDRSTNKVTLSTSENEIQNSENVIVVSPNPSKDKFSVSISNTEQLEFENITVYNLLGEIVFTSGEINLQPLTEFEIDLSLQTKGLYFLQMNTGSNISTKKIILE